MTGSGSGDSTRHRASLGHDAVPVSHPSCGTVPGAAILPGEPSLPTHQPGRGEQGWSRWVWRMTSKKSKLLIHSCISAVWIHDTSAFISAALLRLRGRADKVLTELKEMKEEAAHTQRGVTIHEFFKKRSYRQPIIIVLVVNLGSQLSGFNAVMRTFVWLTAVSGVSTFWGSAAAPPSKSLPPFLPDYQLFHHNVPGKL